MVVVSGELNVVTGAFGYTGRYIAERLLSTGKAVRTLTGHPDRESPFGDRVGVAPLDFDHPAALAEHLRGATTLYNTYWIRFKRGRLTYDRAVENTRRLIVAAVEAGIRRVVHVSITNASEDSPLPYFRGKGIVEGIIHASGMSHAILRPTVIFGIGDILINNIAWILRRFPVFAIPGSGDYRLQPVFVEDVAEMAVAAARGDENVVIDAVGPETYTFDDLVRTIARKVQSRSRILHVPPGLTFLLCRAVGCLVRDVVLTRDEIRGLMANLLVSACTPTGSTRLSDWLARNADRVGRRYASELRRHYR